MILFLLALSTLKPEPVRTENRCAFKPTLPVDVAVLELVDNDTEPLLNSEDPDFNSTGAPGSVSEPPTAIRIFPLATPAPDDVLKLKLPEPPMPLPEDATTSLCDKISILPDKAPPMVSPELI